MANPAITTKFRCTPTSVKLHQEQKGSVIDNLPAAVYRVTFNPFEGYFLSVVSDKFELPAKVYGVSEMPIQQIIDAYSRSVKQMGVLLAGTKGAGKTLLSQILCNRMIAEQNMPVILVDQAFNDQAFFDFVNDLGEVIMVFDEFAKVYGNEQNRMLTFFDGANVQSKRMAIVIENGIKTVSDFMIDRPSRFMFRLTYDKLSKAVIREMCEDYNLSKEQTRDVQTYASGVYNLSTDMLKALLNYVVATQCSVDDALKVLNVPEVIGFRATSNTKIKLKAIVDLQTGNLDKHILSIGTDFEDYNYINSSYFNIRRISDTRMEIVEERLEQYVSMTNEERSENNLPLMTKKEIDERKSKLIRNESNGVDAYTNSDNVTKRFREETQDWVIALPDYNIAVVYEEIPPTDIEAIINSI